MSECAVCYAENDPAASGAAGVAPSAYYNHDSRDAPIIHRWCAVEGCVKLKMRLCN